MPSDRRSMVPWLSCPEGTGKIPRGDRSHMTLADTLRPHMQSLGDTGQDGVVGRAARRVEC